MKTISGNQQDEHTLSFGSKEEAAAALEERQTHMGGVSSGAVKIAGELVVIANQIVSADIYESSY